MTFKLIVETMLAGLLCFIMASLWLGMLGTALYKIFVTLWFEEREAYVKRLSLVPEHEREYESHVN